MRKRAIPSMIAGRYRVEEMVGVGQTGGVVLRAFDLETASMVVVRSPFVEDGFEQRPEHERAAAVARFTAETEELAKVTKSSLDVEQLLGAGVEESGGEVFPYCVFEWLSGQSLEQHLAERPEPLSIVETVSILAPAARALGAAHALGIAHRDVRPANLWLAEGGGRTTLKVAAFGLATSFGATLAPSPFDPAYGAPEHFKKTYGNVDARTDVYGLALAMVEVLSGARALDGQNETELYLATCNLGKRPTPRARGAQVSPAVDAVFQQALAVDPKRRWPNASAFWDALLPVVAELAPSPPSALPVSEPPPRGSVKSASTTPSRKPSTPAARPPRHTRAGSRRIFWLALALGFGLAVGILGAKRVRDARRTAPTSAPVLSP